MAHKLRIQKHIEMVPTPFLQVHFVSYENNRERTNTKLLSHVYSWLYCVRFLGITQSSACDIMCLIFLIAQLTSSKPIDIENVQIYIQLATN